MSTPSGFARSIEGVEIGIMIREVEDGGRKISLRTSEHYNASGSFVRLWAAADMQRRQARRFQVESQARGMPFCRCWPSADYPGALIWQTEF